MQLKYNGVRFDLLTLDRVERNLVYSPDGTTVLWVAWNILASCIYAPAVVVDGNDLDVGGTSISRNQLDDTYQPDGDYFLETSSALPPPLNDEHNDGSPPSSQNKVAGRNPRFQTHYQTGLGHPIFTDQEILNRLAVPRRPLVISAHMAVSNSGDVDPTREAREVIWLESPRNDLPCDANNGPIVKAVPVTSCQGQATSLAVQLEIETWVPPTEQDRLILSHRWQMDMGRSPGDYLVRQVQGEVVFHAGMLRSRPLNPSWFLEQFLHPIPPGFKRTLGQISLSPGGTTLRYQYQDEDQTVVFSPGKSGCTEVEVIVQGGVTIPTIRMRG